MIVGNLMNFYCKYRAQIYHSGSGIHLFANAYIIVNINICCLTLNASCLQGKMAAG